MSSSIQEQISAAARSQFETQLALWMALNNKAFESAIKLVDLNMNVMKESLDQFAAATRQLMSAQDPQEFFSLVSEQLRPNLDKVLSYGRHVAEIGAGMRAEIAKAGQEQVTDTNLEAAKLVDGVGHVVPDGAGNVFGFLKSAMDNANAGYEQFLKTAKQNADAMQANLTMVAHRVASEAKKANGRAKK